MFKIQYTIRCDECCRNEAILEGEDLESARIESFDTGWRTIQIRDGSFWNFCPNCFTTMDPKDY